MGADVLEDYRVGAIDAVLTKLDAEGNLLWTHRWDEDDHILADLETDPEGNTFVGGSVGRSVGVEGFVGKVAIAYAAGTVGLSRFDAEGELL